MKSDPPVYCTAEEVAETIALPDPNNNLSQVQFSDVSHPSLKQVNKMIKANEGQIDLLLKRSWRTNYIKNQLLDIPAYWHDTNSWRMDKFSRGGNEITLMPNVLDWDVWEGDRLEIRTKSGKWITISGTEWVDLVLYEKDENGHYILDAEGKRIPVLNSVGGVQYEYNDDGNRKREQIAINPEENGDMWQGFWIDHPGGRLFLKTRSFIPEFNSLRISYRYGAEVPYKIDEETGLPELDMDGNKIVDYDEIVMPEQINRICCLMTAKQVIASNPFYIKVGAGGDISSARDSLFREIDAEIAEKVRALGRIGPVLGLTG